MECSCDCECDGGVPIENIKTTYPKAERRWNCSECNRPIPTGEQYERITGTREREKVVYRTCLGCQRLRNDVGLVWCNGFLREEIKRCLKVDIWHPEQP